MSTMEMQPAGDPTGTAAKILSMLALAKELPDDAFTLKAAIVESKVDSDIISTLGPNGYMPTRERYTAYILARDALRVATAYRQRDSVAQNIAPVIPLFATPFRTNTGPLVPQRGSRTIHDLLRYQLFHSAKDPSVSLECLQATMRGKTAYAELLILRRRTQSLDERWKVGVLNGMESVGEYCAFDRNSRDTLQKATGLQPSENLPEAVATAHHLLAFLATSSEPQIVNQ